MKSNLESFLREKKSPMEPHVSYTWRVVEQYIREAWELGREEGYEKGFDEGYLEAQEC